MDLSTHPFPYLKKWTILASRLCAHIICVSESERLKIIQHVPKSFGDKLIVIHNGVFIPKSVNRIERPDGRLILSNSRLVPDKGIKELLEGFSAVTDKSTYLWVIGGYSGNHKLYQDIVKHLNISNRVKFLGYVNSPYDYIAIADIFIHASYHEAFSLAIVEAAVMGKPIIATNVGGAPEIIDESNGVLIPPKNPQAITDSIDKLLSDFNHAAKLGNTLKKKARSRYDFNKIVKQRIIPLYES